MWVRMLRDRDWTPPQDRRRTWAYKAGMEVSIKDAWGRRMIADGDAERIPAPARDARREPGSPGTSKGPAG